MPDLKPCPFCGGQASISVDLEAVVDTEGRRWAFTVVCNRCCATSGLTYLPEKAREAWNRRADAAPVVHGRWIYHDDGVITCSECGNAESSDSYYCRYCGAKMDGEP